MTASAEIAKASVRRLASEILLKVDTRKSYADILLDHALKNRVLDRARSSAAHGTGLRHASLARQNRRAVKSSLTPPVGANRRRAQKSTTRSRCYQLVFLDRIPDYAAVNEAVALAKTRGGAKAAGFVNGVLRSFLRQAHRNIAPNSEDLSLAALAIEYSHPPWLVQCWCEEFGGESARELMRANNERAPLVLRVNSLQCAREELLQRFATAGVDATAGNWSPQGNFSAVSGAQWKICRVLPPGFFKCKARLRSWSLFCLSPLPGERILDACAAPGGKSTHIAELMKDQGELVAIDNSARGIERIRAERRPACGLNRCTLVCADIGEKLPTAHARDPTTVFLSTRLAAASAPSLPSRNQMAAKRKRHSRLSRLQAKILRRVVAYLKPGGGLGLFDLYSDAAKRMNKTSNFFG